MAAAPVLAGASGPVEEAPPRLISLVLVLVGLVDEVRVRVAEIRVPLVLLRVVGIPVPKLGRPVEVTVPFEAALQIDQY